MTSPIPRIAIPEPTSSDAAYNQRSLPQYIRAVEAAGGIAVPIPLLESAASQASLAGVVLGDSAAGKPGRCGPHTIRARGRESVRSQGSSP